MKKLIFSVSFFFSFFSFLVAQNVGDQKPQAEVFIGQPVWLALNKSDVARKLVVSEYFSLQEGDQVLCWNAITDGNAEVQVFLPSDFIWVVTRPDGSEFLYKFGCNNRMKYIKIRASALVIIRDTVRIETVIVEKPAEDTRVPVGGYLTSTGTEYGFTPSQERFFYFENQEDMRARTYRPWGRGRSCSSGGYGYDVQRYAVFQENPPRHGGKKYYGHRK